MAFGWQKFDYHPFNYEICAEAVAQFSLQDNIILSYTSMINLNILFSKFIVQNDGNDIRLHDKVNNDEENKSKYSSGRYQVNLYSIIFV